jgi:hypothetical protein
MNHVTVSIKSVEESPNYNTDPLWQGFNPLIMNNVIITKNGMESGVPSLDLQFVDQKGNKHMALIPGNIFRAIYMAAHPCFGDVTPKETKSPLAL